MMVDVYHDYFLTGPITYFEAYMFCTTPRHIARETTFSEFHFFREDNDDTDALTQMWNAMTEILDAWSKETGRCVAMTSHYRQLNNGQPQMPHVHIMYQKARKTTDELPKLIWKSLIGYIPQDW